jgi:hypothetical protein
VGQGSRRIDRRSFLSAGAGAALVCTIGGERVVLRDAGDAKKADRLARGVKRPKARGAQAGDEALQFPPPQPAPGGKVREHWIEARSIEWDIVPKRRDEWHDERVSGPTRYRRSSTRR